MAALTANTDRRCSIEPNGIRRNLPLLAAAQPFLGSLLGFDPSTGYVDKLTAGRRFAGIAMQQINVRDTPTLSGAQSVRALCGYFTFVAVIAGITQADIVARRAVYASSDNDLSLTAESGNSFVGFVADRFSQVGGLTNGVVIQAITADLQLMDNGLAGLETLADAPATLTTSQLGKTLYMPNTAARTLTLPPAASCTGRTFTVVKTTAAAFAVTLQGNAAENINSANTYATATAQWSVAEIRSDGTQWVVLRKI